MSTLEVAGVKMFDSKATAKKFVDILAVLSDESGSLAGEQFSKIVTELFWAKVSSVDGEFEEFKVTEKDLLKIVDNHFKNE